MSQSNLNNNNTNVAVSDQPVALGLFDDDEFTSLDASNTSTRLLEPTLTNQDSLSSQPYDFGDHLDDLTLTPTTTTTTTTSTTPTKGKQHKTMIGGGYGDVVDDHNNINNTNNNNNHSNDIIYDDEKFVHFLTQHELYLNYLLQPYDLNEEIDDIVNDHLGTPGIDYDDDDDYHSGSDNNDNSDDHDNDERFYDLNDGEQDYLINNTNTVNQNTSTIKSTNSNGSFDSGTDWFEKRRKRTTVRNHDDYDDNNNANKTNTVDLNHFLHNDSMNDINNDDTDDNTDYYSDQDDSNINNTTQYTNHTLKKNDVDIFYDVKDDGDVHNDNNDDDWDLLTELQPQLQARLASKPLKTTTSPNNNASIDDLGSTGNNIINNTNTNAPKRLGKFSLSNLTTKKPTNITMNDDAGTNSTNTRINDDAVIDGTTTKTNDDTDVTISINDASKQNDDNDQVQSKRRYRPQGDGTYNYSCPVPPTDNNNDNNNNNGNKQNNNNNNNQNSNINQSKATLPPASAVIATLQDKPNTLAALRQAQKSSRNTKNGTNTNTQQSSQLKLTNSGFERQRPAYSIGPDGKMISNEKSLESLMKEPTNASHGQNLVVHKLVPKRGRRAAKVVTSVDETNKNKANPFMNGGNQLGNENGQGGNGDGQQPQQQQSSDKFQRAKYYQQHQRPGTNTHHQGFLALGDRNKQEMIDNHYKQKVDEYERSMKALGLKAQVPVENTTPELIERQRQVDYYRNKVRTQAQAKQSRLVEYQMMLQEQRRKQQRQIQGHDDQNNQQIESNVNINEEVPSAPSLESLNQTNNITTTTTPHQRPDPVLTRNTSTAAPQPSINQRLGADKPVASGLHKGSTPVTNTTKPPNPTPPPVTSKTTTPQHPLVKQHQQQYVKQPNSTVQPTAPNKVVEKHGINKLHPLARIHGSNKSPGVPTTASTTTTTNATTTTGAQPNNVNVNTNLTRQVTSGSVTSRPIQSQQHPLVARKQSVIEQQQHQQPQQPITTTIPTTTQTIVQHHGIPTDIIHILRERHIIHQRKLKASGKYITPSIKRPKHFLQNYNHLQYENRSNIVTLDDLQQMVDLRSTKEADFEGMYCNTNDPDDVTWYLPPQSSSNGNNKQPRSNFSSINSLESIMIREAAREMVKLTNLFRQGEYPNRELNGLNTKGKLSPLLWDSNLGVIGYPHSKDMALGKVPFEHVGFNNRINQYPRGYNNAGENLAMGIGQGISEMARCAVDGWITSPGHRENLLGNYKWCGIGLYRRIDGGWYATQMLGSY